MGFTPEPTVYTLEFEEGTPLHGLVVKASPCTIGEWNDMLRMSGETRTNLRETADSNERVAELMLSHLVSWNLEIPTGTPVPATQEGFRLLENPHGSMIISAWQRAMVDVPTNSPKSSDSGKISAEEQLGLGNSSESLPNWGGPS